MAIRVTDEQPARRAASLQGCSCSSGATRDLNNRVAALTQACVDTLGSRPESVDILLFDVKPSDWATGGELWSDKKKQ
jgi:phenylpyruvate tautomerase PptA (4-oxalocrotonate tautomerase family)